MMQHYSGDQLHTLVENGTLMNDCAYRKRSDEVVLSNLKVIFPPHRNLPCILRTLKYFVGTDLVECFRYVLQFDVAKDCDLVPFADEALKGFSPRVARFLIVEKKIQPSAASIGAIPSYQRPYFNQVFAGIWKL